MDSARDGQAATPNYHQDPRELSEGETTVPPEHDTRGEEGGEQDEVGAAEQRKARVARGSQRYYRKKRNAKLVRGTQRYYNTFYSQFTNIVMVSAFLGSLEAAILSFLRDILSEAPLGNQLFRQGKYNSVDHVYSSYWMGLMFGLVSVSLSLTAAIVAVVNAALACHLSLHTKGCLVLMEKRVALCMAFQFLGLVCALMSLFLLWMPLSFTVTMLILALPLLGVCQSE